MNPKRKINNAELRFLKQAAKALYYGHAAPLHPNRRQRNIIDFEGLVRWIKFSPSRTEITRGLLQKIMEKERVVKVTPELRRKLNKLMPPTTMYKPTDLGRYTTHPELSAGMQHEEVDPGRVHRRPSWQQ